jgi:hypothetical protein
LFCGEDGIRTHDTLLGYTHFPGVRHRPTRPPLQFISAKEFLTVILLNRGAKVQNKFTHQALKKFYSENLLSDPD